MLTLQIASCVKSLRLISVSRDGVLRPVSRRIGVALTGFHDGLRSLRRGQGPKDLDNPEDPREITMQRLIEGYSRFRTNVFPQHSQLFERLAMGQTPQALFIACSDSRVMPEMVMQCDPGDLFPCRNAGNLVPPPTETTSGVAATIEYAIRVLKIPDVVFCGD